jgi:predicted nucleotidyltransferase
LRGDAVPGSDVDLLVVLSRAEKPFLDRIPGYAVDIEGMDVDVFPYTEDELARMLAEGNSLLAEALREGEWLVGGYPDGLTVASKSK